MNRNYHTWWSDRLQKEMELLVYGTEGYPVLIFPTSSGRFFDFEERGMVHSIAEFIEREKIVLYTIDSLDGESWDNPSKSPEERARRHEDYDEYVVQEVVPFINGRNSRSDRIVTGGVSMGAFHAVNFLLRHPDCFGGTIALSGIYNVRFFLGNYGGDDTNVYYNSPMEYLPQLTDDWFLHRLRCSDIYICVGQGAWEEPMLYDTKTMKDIFDEKQIPAFVDFWGNDVNHDWPWWQKQFPYFLHHLLKKRGSGL